MTTVSKSADPKLLDGLKERRHGQVRRGESERLHCDRDRASKSEAASRKFLPHHRREIKAPSRIARGRPAVLPVALNGMPSPMQGRSRPDVGALNYTCHVLSDGNPRLCLRTACPKPSFPPWPHHHGGSAASRSTLPRYAQTPGLTRSIRSARPVCRALVRCGAIHQRVKLPAPVQVSFGSSKPDDTKVTSKRYAYRTKLGICHTGVVPGMPVGAPGMAYGDARTPTSFSSTSAVARPSLLTTRNPEGV